MREMNNSLLPNGQACFMVVRLSVEFHLREPPYTFVSSRGQSGHSRQEQIQMLVLEPFELTTMCSTDQSLKIKIPVFDILSKEQVELN